MSRRSSACRLGIALVLAAAFGCRSSRQVSYLGSADLKHYRDYATAVEYPVVETTSTAEIANSLKPRTIKDREKKDKIWDVSLVQVVHMAVANNKLIRTRQNAGQIIDNPQQAASVYDTAIRESGPLFGNRGVEAALSDFDAQFSTSMNWGRNAQVQNSIIPFPGFVSAQETAAFTSSLSKTFATGGNMALAHNWNYLGSNSNSALFPSAYTGVLSAQYRQPLWAASGVEYNRIAGPSRSGLGSITGVSQGVAIARINSDISITEFENTVVDMVKDVEDLYWDLYLAYRQYDAELANGRSSLRTWREVKARRDVGATGGNLSAEAQARENYFQTRSRVETALANLYSTEGQLRRIIGLPMNDGQCLRPADTPLEGEYIPHWEISLAESLTRRVELRRQKWQIKSLELQHTAAQSLCNPRLDFVSSYQINGFGDNLLASDMQDGRTAVGYGSAYGSLGRSSQTGWGLGFELSMPIGFRAALAQVRNVELQLMKARSGLAAQELEISHELGAAIQSLDSSYTTAQTHLDRLVAAEARVNATQAEYEAQIKDATLDLVLRAQAARAQAEIEYYTSIVRYNQAIAEFHRRKGTLLEHNNITLAESEWTADAHQDALKRAWARSFASDNPHLETQPAEFATPSPYSGHPMEYVPPQNQEYPSAGSTEVPPAPKYVSDPPRTTYHELPE